MSGHKAGGIKARDKNLAKDPDHYKKIGSKGGSAKHTSPRGFAAMNRKRVMAAGRKGGRRGWLVRKAKSPVCSDCNKYMLTNKTMKAHLRHNHTIVMPEVV